MKVHRLAYFGACNYFIYLSITRSELSIVQIVTYLISSHWYVSQASLIAHYDVQVTPPRISCVHCNKEKQRLRTDVTRCVSECLASKPAAIQVIRLRCIYTCIYM